MSRVVRPRVSYADLQQGPEDGRRYELYDGEVFVVPSPLPKHQRVTLRIAGLLDAYAQRHGGEALVSPIDIVFSEFDVLQPDVVFFQRDREHLVRAEEPIRSVPDLVIEVLSMSTAAMDRGRKMQVFARYGVCEYWIIDPHLETLEVYALTGQAFELIAQPAGEERIRSSIFPALELSADQIFARPRAAE